MAPNLAPTPHPGLTVYPGFTAQNPESFLFKSRDLWSNKASFLISHATPSGKALAPFLSLKEESKDTIIFKTLNGQEVMRIIRNSRNWTSKGAKYYGMRGEEEIWQLRLVRGLKGTNYELDIHDRAAYGWRVEVHNKVQGQEKGIFIEGNPVATMSRFEVWKHIARHDIVHVAPGMDILIALGVNWIRVDKQEQDAVTAAVVVA
ncbi:hypothetical protein T440DRAFT_469240 [Plenodomus tracheiphilus IPT5]|uniref:Uncharacterized protein n=1 Tax=Plenodomus tracheiphilus IPT5 TaxID=1408161 RepID=A0A6A7B2S7_9PLEO|nr:hypothetical protein T440DRAFT_469240 [Plenodomus tracheiphilus IPT5]